MVPLVQDAGRQAAQRNAFGYEERALDKKRDTEVVAETHEAWKQRCAGKIKKGNLWPK